MSKAKTPQPGRRSRVPLVLAFAAACVIAPLAFLVLLPGPPERAEKAGGETTVTKQVPGASENSVPEPPTEGSAAEQNETSREDNPQALADAAQPATSPTETPSGMPRSRGRMELIAPETEATQQSGEPAGSAGDESEPPDPPGEGTDVSAQVSRQVAQESAPDPGSDQAATESPEPMPEAPESAAGQATSPSPEEPGADWQMDLEAAEEPPEASQQASTSAESSTSEEASASGAGNLPSETELAGWIESQAKEFLGGVDEEGNILYRFDVWVSAPPALQSKIKSVAYSYGAPSATPESQESVEPRTQFKVSFGALSCAKEVAVTITLDDGRTQQTVVNGCQILN